jgi:hypothetical protein
MVLSSILGLPGGHCGLPARYIREFAVSDKSYQVPNAGLPQTLSKLKLTFREGGAYDFQTALNGIVPRMPAEGQLAEPLPLYSPTTSSLEPVTVVSNTDLPTTDRICADGRPPAYETDNFPVR